MSLPIAVSLLALLVALFALVALVAVYARVRALEAGSSAELTGYATLVGRAAPRAVHPRAGEPLTVVAVLDADCALCHGLWAGMGELAAQRPAGARFVGLVDAADRVGDLPVVTAGRAELLADPVTRADLYEGYAPTLLVVDATGTVAHRSFVYADTDVRSLLLDLTERLEVTRA